MLSQRTFWGKESLELLSPVIAPLTRSEADYFIQLTGPLLAVNVLKWHALFDLFYFNCVTWILNVGLWKLLLKLVCPGYF